jgi:hypothetical protein
MSTTKSDINERGLLRGMASGLGRIPPTPPPVTAVVSQDEDDSDGDSAYHFCLLATGGGGVGGDSEAPGYNNGKEQHTVPGNSAKLVYG